MYKKKLKSQARRGSKEGIPIDMIDMCIWDLCFYVIFFSGVLFCSVVLCRVLSCCFWNECHRKKEK